jgi:hypothetical protein
MGGTARFFAPHVMTILALVIAGVFLFFRRKKQN